MKKNAVKALIIYKRSPLLAAGTSIAAANARFRENHVCHYATLRKVEMILEKYGISHHVQLRGSSFDRQGCALIITVGGDGTFLDAARKASEKQLILGVNSDPSWSVGKFCAADSNSFERVLKQTLSAPRFKKVFRLQAVFLDKGPGMAVECLNDVLVCHANPAAMSRYSLSSGRRVEEQRSSGIWFSSAAGATGAIASAGGLPLPLGSRKIQYKPRELYHGVGSPYKLTGGSIKAGEPITITSRMHHGRVFLDGAHIKYPLTFGQTLRINTSPHFIRMIHA